MAKIKAMDCQYEACTLYGKTVLFTSIRIDASTVPKGLYLYEMRRGDEDGFEPVQLAKGILINHFGTILSRKPIKLDHSGYRDIHENDFEYQNKALTIEKFIKKPKQYAEPER